MTSDERIMLTGNKAAAWGARMAQVEYVPAFPITPQTEIVETLAKWFSDGTMKGKFTNMDSEHSMFMAAGAGAATGVRVFTASSSQGILHGMESLYTMTGWRVPLVIVNVSRALATPITLEPDHNDVMSTRDCGLIQLHAETCQEVFDFILLGYHIAENPDVCLPVLVNMDGFYLSFTREPVLVPNPESIANFLTAFKPAHPVFQASQPMARASAVFGGATYSYFKMQHNLAAYHAEKVFNDSAQKFSELFGRTYEPAEKFHMDDAEFVFVMSNSFATKGKAAVLQLRRQGIKVGLLKLRLFRPFPSAFIAEALSGHKNVAIIDQNLSPGMGGITYPEIVASLYSHPNRPKRILSVIGGLGGKDIRESDFMSIINHFKDPESPSPLYLFDDADMASFQKVQNIANPKEEQSSS
jgi:pyruvate ferredoxin oxidoreductase alpha subunit